MENSKLNFDDLDDETKKSIEGQTIFTDEDGTVDHTRGAGKSLYNKLNFFVHNVNGVDFENIVLNVGIEAKPQDDIDGKWHLVNGNHLMKCFSKGKFDLELTNFLEHNGNSKDSDVEITVEQVSQGLLMIANYKCNNFRIEVPQNGNADYETIVIFENEKEEDEKEDNKEEPKTVNPEHNKKQDSTSKLFETANYFQDNNEHKRAIEYYQHILNRSKNDESLSIIDNKVIEGLNVTVLDAVYLYLGLSHRACKEFNKALEAIEKAIEINPNTYAQVFYELGITKMMMGDFTTCVDDFTKVLKIDKNYFNAYYMRAAALINVDCEFHDIDLAKNDLKIYLKKYPKDEAANRLFQEISSF
tara:strand:- start:222 stop:1295 length:1074 start_codon:yes stop_codon:yes gene_type:complete